MTLWYYSKLGLQQGPVPEHELLQKIRRAEIDGNNLAWKEGMAEWLPISRIPELNGQVGVPAASASPDRNPAAAMPQSHPGGHVPLPQPPAYQGNYIAPHIPTYMWQSVVATVVGLIFCCVPGMPFGIVAIVFASKVEGLRVQGDYFGAMTASNNAKTWMITCFVCAGLGFLINLFYLLAGLYS